MKLSIFSTLPQILKQEIIRYLGYSFYLECLYPYKYKKVKIINKSISKIKKRIFGTIVSNYKRYYTEEGLEWLEWLEVFLRSWANKNVSFPKIWLNYSSGMEKLITSNYKNVHFRIFNKIPATNSFGNFGMFIDFHNYSSDYCIKDYCNCDFCYCDCMPQELENIINVLTINEIKKFYDYNDKLYITRIMDLTMN